MTNLGKSIRPKRFKAKGTDDIILLIETKDGDKIRLKVENCSLNGIGAALEDKNDTDKVKAIQLGDIIPHSKLLADNFEYFLGRLALKAIIEQDGLRVGFHSIDTKVPLDGNFSKFFLDLFSSEKSIYDYEMNPDKFSVGQFIGNDSLNDDLFSKCKQFAIYFQELERSPKYLHNAVRTPSFGTTSKLTIRRTNGRNDYIAFGSNDYLGLSCHPKVIEATKEALDKYGFGSTGSPLSTGTTILHEQLSEVLAKIFKKDKAILFNSGYAANVGGLAGLIGASDLAVTDILSHNSINAGLDLASGNYRYFRHNDYRHLEKVLNEHRASHSGSLVITEGVFSMDGDYPPLDKIVEVAHRHNCRTYVDEAHSFGVLGENGYGAVEKFHLENKVDLIMGTFSKICGGIGGFLAGDKDVMDWLVWNAKARIFSVSLPPSSAAAMIAALEVLRNDSNLIKMLQNNIAHFVKGLRDLGSPISSSHETAVIPLEICDEKKMGIINEVLLESGIYVVPIFHPIVRKNRCRFRFTIMATHTTSELDLALSAIEKGIKKADFSFSQVSQKS